MAYSQYKITVFGPTKAGLTTVGYRLYNADGTSSGARIATSIQDLNSGQYGALITFPDNFSGRITWDTGEATPIYASEEINPVSLTSPVDVVVYTFGPPIESVAIADRSTYTTSAK